MKNKMGTMALTGVLALTAAFSMTAFAEDTKPAEPSTGGASIVQDKLATTDMKKDDAATAVAMPNFASTTGKIENVTKDGENYTISITNDDMGMVYHVATDVFVINRKDNSYMKISDLKKGMEITGIVRGNSPQTMSIPPQTPGAIGFVVNEGEGFTSIGRFDGELTNAADKLKLNIDEKTMIVDQKGSKKVFTAEDVKNQDLVVFYTTTTRSIPAQTAPDFVMILDAPVIAEVDTKAVEPIAAAELTASTPAESAPIAEPKTTESQAEAAPVAREMLALRETAEAAGYTIKWTSNDAPVVLEKGGITVSVTVGEKKFSKLGITNIASDATVLKGAQIFIAADIADALK